MLATLVTRFEESEDEEDLDFLSGEEVEKSQKSSDNEQMNFIKGGTIIFLSKAITLCQFLVCAYAVKMLDNFCIFSNLQFETGY